jgi:HlyD family secretion protein
MWIALGSLLALLVAFVAWLVFARAPIATPVDGVLTSGSGEILPAGTGVTAIALVPISRSGGIEIGEDALVSPISAPAPEYGLIRGTVTDVGRVPVSPERLEDLTGTVAGLADALVQDEPVIEVRIDLQADPSTVSGLRWTLGAGPPFTLLPGTIFTGEIVQGSQSPFARLFG